MHECTETDSMLSLLHLLLPSVEVQSSFSTADVFISRLRMRMIHDIIENTTLFLQSHLEQKGPSCEEAKIQKLEY